MNKIQIYYYDLKTCCAEGVFIPTIKLAFDDLNKNIIEKIFAQQELSQQDNRQLFAQDYAPFKEAIEQGINHKITTIEYGKPNFTLVKNLQTNVAVFAAFKNHNLSKDLVKKLIDKATNQPLPFNKFKTEATKIIGAYKKQYLQVEYNQAIRASRMATKWAKSQENANVYPYLKYVRSRAAKPTQEHLALVGIIKRKDDPFWDKYYPPNRWGCKCDVEDISQATPTPTPTNITDVPLEFQFNPGKSGQVFNEKKHPYFDLPQPQYLKILHEAKKALYHYESKALLKSGIHGQQIKVHGIEKEIRITRTSLNENLYYNDTFLDRLNILYNISSILKKAIYLKTEPNKKIETKPSLVKMHVLQYNDIKFKIAEYSDGRVDFYWIEVKNKP